MTEGATSLDSPRNVVWQPSTVRREDRERLAGHPAYALWLTGLSGSGKTTLAHALEAALYARGKRTCVLDGDNLRHGLCSDLGFSDADRRENLRRVREVTRLMVDTGVIVITAFISPFADEREAARKLLPQGRFLEVHCAAPLGVCEGRDVKGLYRRARAGEVAQFTGISSPYEAPESPDIRLDTANRTVAQCTEDLLTSLGARGLS